MGELVSFTFGGAFLGLCAGLIVKQAGKTRDIDYKKLLDFEPWYFDSDSVCAQMFIKLQHYKHYSPNHFNDAGDATDALLCLLHTAYSEKSGNGKWSSDLAKEANAHYIKANSALQKFALDARYWLYDLPILNFNKLKENDTENEKVMMERIKSGEILAVEIGELKDHILHRLKKHVLKLIN